MAKLDLSGNTLVYGTYLGGGGWDWALAIAVDAAGSAYVTGVTESADFPTTAGAFDRTLGTRPDAFVAKLALGAAPAPQPSVTFTPPAVPQGGTVAVSGGGFSTSAFSTSALTATVRLVDSAVTTSTVATLGTAALRGRGSFSSVPLTVPVTAPVGVYRVQATDGVLTATSAATLTVLSGHRLAFGRWPIRAAHGYPFGFQPRVALQDTAGITLTADSSTVVTLTIKPGTGASGAVLTCDQTQGGVASTRVLSGTATFSGCAIDRPGAGYVLVAAAAGLPLFETAPFNVTLAGDTNGDGRVSIADYSLLVTHFGKSRASADWRDATTRPWRADLDGDEAVDVVDHSIAVTRFGTSTTVAVAPSDPSAGP